MNPIFLTIIFVPVIEIYLLIKIGSEIGAITTILLIFITAIVGVYYAKYEGLNTLRSGFNQLKRNETPTYEMLSGAAIAFATVYFNFSSTLAAKVGVLNDLYTTPAYRSSGVGRELIEHCRQFAQRRGAIRLQWLTATDNLTAQRLYDSLDTRKSDWHFYTYSTGTGP